MRRQAAERCGRARSAAVAIGIAQKEVGGPRPSPCRVARPYRARDLRARRQRRGGGLRVGSEADIIDPIIVSVLRSWKRRSRIGDRIAPSFKTVAPDACGALPSAERRSVGSSLALTNPPCPFADPQSCSGRDGLGYPAAGCDECIGGPLLATGPQAIREPRKVAATASNGSLGPSIGEPEVHHIAVLDDVILALEPHFAGLPGR